MSYFLEKFTFICCSRSFIHGLTLCRPKEFIECDDPIDHKGNKTAKEEMGMGCVKVYTLECFDTFSLRIVIYALICLSIVWRSKV